MPHVDQIRRMGEAFRRSKILHAVNTHDMEHLERVDLGCDWLVRREVLVRQGNTGDNRATRRVARQARKATRRREARAKLRKAKAVA